MTAQSVEYLLRLHQEVRFNDFAPDKALGALNTP